MLILAELAQKPLFDTKFENFLGKTKGSQAIKKISVM